MPSSAEKTVIRLRNPPAPLRIRQWPLRDEPLRSVLIAGAVTGIALGTGLTTSQWSLAAMFFVLLNLTLARMWLPAEYEFSSKGIVCTCVRRRTRIAWSDIGRYDYQPDGVTFSPDSHPLPLAPLRSLFIRWNGRRDELSALIDFYLAPDLPSSQTSTQAFVRPS